MPIWLLIVAVRVRYERVLGLGDGHGPPARVVKTLYENALFIKTFIGIGSCPCCNVASVMILWYRQQWRASIDDNDAYGAVLLKISTLATAIPTVSDCDFNAARVLGFGGKLNVSYSCIDRHSNAPIESRAVGRR